MSEKTIRPRFYTPTPGKLVLALLIVELVLLLDYQDGGTVLTGIAVFILTILAGLVWFVGALVLRRKFQFSILSLCGLMLCLAILGSWFAWKMERAKRQAAVVKRIEELGGYAWYEKTISPSKVLTGVDLEMLLLGVNFLSDIDCVGLSETHITDTGLEHLEGLTKLSILDLGNTQITNAGLEHLKGMNNLKWVSLQETQVTPGGIKELQQALPDCEITHDFK